MTPVLFNLYMCVVIEYWTARVGTCNPGINLRIRYDKALSQIQS